MIRPTSVHPITDFKRNTKHFLTRLRKTGLPEVLTVDGRGEVVVQDAAAYEQLLELVERAEAMLGIQRGLEDQKQGRTMSLQQAGNKLRGLQVADRGRGKR